MIAGSIDVAGRPTIRVQISDGSPPHREIAAVIATECDAELALPLPLIAELGLPRIGNGHLVLGGVERPAQTYVAFVRWHHGLMRLVTAMETDGVPLIGIGLLRGSFLRADFMDGGEVAVYGID